MDFIPGFIQGLTRVSISYPFETVKIQLQKNKYNSTYDAISDMLKNNPKLFYKGSQFSYISVPFDRSLQFYLNEKMKNKYNSYLVGTITGLIGCTYNVPINYICTNAIMTKKSAFNIFIDGIKERKIYNGSSIECLRCVSASTIYMGTYFHLRENYCESKNTNIIALYGCFSNIICWLITFPMDSIRTDMQTSDKQTITKVILTKYKINGFRQFYKGITPVLIRTMPSSFTGSYMYEQTRKYLKLM